MSGFIGVVCGLKSEAAAVRAAAKSAGVDPAKLRIGVSGADASRAARIADEFCKKGAAALISVGVSGGLDPSLRPGDLVIGERVLTSGADVYLSDERLIGAAPEALARRAVLLGSDTIIATTDAKKALFTRYAACAVDMESHGVARSAKIYGKPFVAVRAIADAAERALPKAALNAVDSSGGVRTLSVLMRCVFDPKQIEELMQLGRESGQAFETLRRDFGGLLRGFLLVLDL